jgi:iron uptake system component EfeO
VLALATALIALTACGDDGGSGSGEAAGGDGASSVTLTMTEAGCDPVSLSAPAGSVEFAVTNESGLKGEFEVISSAPEILTEEFLEDGASGTFTVSLQPGQYQVICGAPSNTRADLWSPARGRPPR